MWRHRTLCVAVVVFAGLLLWGMVEAEKYMPFRLLEGISLWPTEILRIVGAVLAFSFLRVAKQALDRIRGKLTERFFPELASRPKREPGGCLMAQAPPASEGEGQARAGRPPKVATSDEDVKRNGLRHSQGRWRRVGAKAGALLQRFMRAWQPPEESSDREVVWLDCLHQSRRRWRRVVPKVAVFLLLFIVVFLRLGFPHVPARGALSGWLDHGILAVSIILFLGLLFYVADTASLCSTYAPLLLKSNLNRYSGEIQNRFGGPLRLDIKSPESQTVIDTWTGIRLIAEWTSRINPLIYYPFIIMALMLVARSRLFADHNFPPAINLVFGSVLVYALISAHLLRLAAERARRLAIGRLRALDIALAGNEARKAEREKLNLILKHIEELREGAFGGIYQQEYVRALLMLLTSAAGLNAIEYLITGQAW